MVQTQAEPLSELEEHLDPGIRCAVVKLMEAGVETFESCEGGPGHCYPVPTVRFHGGQAEGFRALAAAMQAGLAVASLRRVWTMTDHEPTGPWWELTFVPTTNPVATDYLRNPLPPLPV